jgi:hypothetical protein
MKKGRKNLVN